MKRYISIPRKIINLLEAMPGMVFTHRTIWEMCWSGKYLPECCNNTLRANICYARKLLASGAIKVKREMGYVYIPTAPLEALCQLK